jgi:heterodisulfide reductase subunit C
MKISTVQQAQLFTGSELLNKTRKLWLVLMCCFHCLDCTSSCPQQSLSVHVTRNKSAVLGGGHANVVPTSAF